MTFTLSSDLDIHIKTSMYIKWHCFSFMYKVMVLGTEVQCLCLEIATCRNFFFLFFVRVARMRAVHSSGVTPPFYLVVFCLVCSYAVSHCLMVSSMCISFLLF